MQCNTRQVTSHAQLWWTYFLAVSSCLYSYHFFKNWTVCLSNGWGGWPQRPQRPRILRVCYCFNYGPPATGWSTGQPSPSKTQPSQIHAQKSSELIAFLQQLHTSWIPGLLSSPIEREAGRSLPLVYTKIVHVQIGQPPRFKISGSSAAATESWVMLLYSNLGGR